MTTHLGKSRSPNQPSPTFPLHHSAHDLPTLGNYPIPSPSKPATPGISRNIPFVLPQLERLTSFVPNQCWQQHTRQLPNCTVHNESGVYCTATSSYSSSFPLRLPLALKFVLRLGLWGLDRRSNGEAIVESDHTANHYFAVFRSYIKASCDCCSWYLVSEFNSGGFLFWF